MARLFTRPALFDSMTAAENLMVAQHRRMRGGFFACGLGLALSKHEDRLARRHALELLEHLGIEALADRPVAGLAAGERRLVDLARALAADPRLAILDEPGAGLTKAERKELAERIGMVCDEMGIAVLITGQDFPAVTNLADFVYVLDNGVVVGKGEPDDVAADTRVQAAFLRGVQPFPPQPDGGTPGPESPPGPTDGPPEAN
jgi:ABC-type branched-subunit amino acid transport system ATPase component